MTKTRAQYCTAVTCFVERPSDKLEKKHPVSFFFPDEILTLSPTPTPELQLTRAAQMLLLERAVGKETTKDEREKSVAQAV